LTIYVKDNFGSTRAICCAARGICRFIWYGLCSVFNYNLFNQSHTLGCMEVTVMDYWAKAPIDRNQIALFSPTLDSWIPEDHPVRLFDEILSRLDWSSWESHYDGCVGQPPIHPRVLAGVILYGMSQGIRSRRSLERACANSLDLVPPQLVLYHANSRIFTNARKPWKKPWHWKRRSKLGVTDTPEYIARSLVFPLLIPIRPLYRIKRKVWLPIILLRQPWIVIVLWPVSV
jgi:Transposase domain (DUF772)